MNHKAIMFFSLLFFNQVIAQEAPADGMMLINRITWHTVVYIKEDALSYQGLLNEFESIKYQPEFGCNGLDISGEPQWYCSSEPKLIYRSHDAYGAKTYRINICENNKFIDKYKYFNDEMLIHYECIVVISHGENEPNEFFTMKKWLEER